MIQYFVATYVLWISNNIGKGTIFCMYVISTMVLYGIQITIVVSSGIHDTHLFFALCLKIRQFHVEFQKKIISISTITILNWMKQPHCKVTIVDSHC